jgi:ABC-type glycerol-3-phosphate transport system substrate-binding protein
MYQGNRLYVLVVVAALVAGMLPMGGAVAQEDNTLLLGMPSFVGDFLDPDAFDAFEEQTGYRVQVVDSGFPFFPLPPVGLDAHFDAVAEYVGLADVLMLYASSLSVEATRAGYFLDLAPLTQGDSTLYPDDFYPAAWESFQWDGGVWGLPVVMDVLTFNYNPADFDAVGLAYPSDAWTLDDLAYAARQLTEYDPETGEVAVPGFQATSNQQLALLLRAMAGQGYYDASTLPEMPYLTNPALEPLLDTWIELEAEGIVSTATDSLAISFVENPIPMRIDTTVELASPAGQAPNAAGVLLPGGVAGLDVQGFGVSVGTNHPEMAYELAKYLTNSPEVADALLGTVPARQSLMNLDETGGRMFDLGEYTPEVEAFVQDAIWRALPVAELRYSDYLALALTNMRATGIDGQSALQEVEQMAVTNLQDAIAHRDSVVVEVEPPLPAAELAPGEIALNFGYQSFVSPLPNQAEWDQAIEDFVWSDPDVGQVVFETDFGVALDDMAEQFDCFYLTYNAVPNLNLQTVLNLDPFIDADPAFDRGDVVGNVMTELMRDNKVWAFPMMVQPSVLRYNPDRFAQAGLYMPENGWTIDMFTDALLALKTSPEDPAPFVPRALNGGNYLLMLVAAYGGLPLDYRTTPTTVNFTDPANVDAIRQVLDLARDGYIDYQPLAILDADSATTFNIEFGQSDSEDAIYPDSLDIFGLNIGDFREYGLGGASEGDLAVTYPRGNTYSPASYTINTAYISATAENPDACYRWLSFISVRAELLSGMPARRTLLNDPVFEAAAGSEQAAFYREFDAYMQSPDAVSFPSFGASTVGVGNLVIQQWLFRAFDRYVLQDADLEVELEEVELFVRSYQECEAGIPPYDPDLFPEQDEYAQFYIDCVTRIDPSYETLFGDGE